MDAINPAINAITRLHSPEPVESPPDPPDWPYPPAPPPSPIGEPPPETPAEFADSSQRLAVVF